MERIGLSEGRVDEMRVGIRRGVGLQRLGDHQR